jgi:hypothetical protein
MGMRVSMGLSSIDLRFESPLEITIMDIMVGRMLLLLLRLGLMRYIL